MGISRGAQIIGTGQINPGVYVPPRTRESTQASLGAYTTSPCYKEMSCELQLSGVNKNLPHFAKNLPQAATSINRYLKCTPWGVLSKWQSPRVVFKDKIGNFPVFAPAAQPLQPSYRTLFTDPKRMIQGRTLKNGVGRKYTYFKYAPGWFYFTCTSVFKIFLNFELYPFSVQSYFH